MLNFFRRFAFLLLDFAVSVLLATVLLSPLSFEVIDAARYGKNICTEPRLKTQDKIEVQGDEFTTIVIRIQCGDTKGQIESISPTGIFQGPQKNSKWYKVSQTSSNSKPWAEEHYAATADDDIPNAVIPVKYKCDESKLKIKSCNPSNYDWFDVGQSGTLPAKSGKMYAFTCNEEVEPKISVDFVKTTCTSDSKSTKIDVTARQSIRVQFVCSEKNDAITTCKPDDKTSVDAGGDKKDFGGDSGKKYEIECLADRLPRIRENYFATETCLTSKTASVNVYRGDEKLEVKFQCAPGNRMIQTCQPGADGPVVPTGAPEKIYFGGETGKRYEIISSAISAPGIWRHPYAEEICLTKERTAKFTFNDKSYTVQFVCDSSGEEFESCNANEKGVVSANKGKSFGMMRSKFYLHCYRTKAPCIDASKDDCLRKAKEATN